MDNQALVNNIRRLCNENGISISQLERDLLMSPGLISRWTKNVPTLDRVLDIAEYFNVPLDSITSDTLKQNTRDKLTARLLVTLYNRSINADIEWHILTRNEDEALFSEINSKAATFFKSMKDSDCFYCTADCGYFFMTVKSINTDNPELNLYVMADANSLPELRCSDSEKLNQLYQYLYKRLFKQLNTFKTDAFIEQFLSSSPQESSTQDKKNDKITVIRKNSNAANE